MQPFASPLTLAERLTLWHFRKRLPRSRRADFDACVANIFSDEAPPGTSRASRTHAMIAACVLCSVEQWQKLGRSREEAKEKTRPVVLGLWKHSNAVMAKLGWLFVRDPMRSSRRYTAQMAEHVYGPSFTMHDEQIEGGFASVVTVCGYCTLFGKRDAADLVELLCEWDRTWIDTLPRTIAFSRPTTLAAGDECCRFEFRQSH